MSAASRGARAPRLRPAYCFARITDANKEPPSPAVRICGHARAEPLVWRLLFALNDGLAGSDQRCDAVGIERVDVELVDVDRGHVLSVRRSAAVRRVPAGRTATLTHTMLGGMTHRMRLSAQVRRRSRQNLDVASKQGLIDQIEADALDTEVPLTDALRRCVMLGGRSGSTALMDWATRQLDGYPNDTDLPEYRVIHAPLRMDGMAMQGDAIQSDRAGDRSTINS